MQIETHKCFSLTNTFYWNNHVHPEAEQPSLEFTESMGKE